MFKTIAVWLGWSDADICPTKTLDEVYKMIREGESFKAIVDRDIYKHFSSHTSVELECFNYLSSYIHKGIYYEGRTESLHSTNYVDTIAFDEITIIPNKEDDNGKI